LAEDHAHAQTLAQGLSEIPGVEIDLASVQTNLIFFGLSSELAIEPAEFITKLAEEHNIKIGGRGGRDFRIVTHYWITPSAVDTVLNAFRTILSPPGH